MTIVEFLRETHIIDAGWLEARPYIECADGFRMSIQASGRHLCQPRSDDTGGEYSEVEIYTTAYDPLLATYPGAGYIYPYVSIDVTQAVVNKHGGIARLIPAMGGVGELKGVG